MEVERKIRKFGNSLGVYIPSDFAKSMGVDVGDTVHMRYEDNKIIISKEPGGNSDPEFKKKVIAILDEYMDQNKK